ncbi:GNAT family N-acetyltransferase [Lacticaseibacillus sp. GG6-2]
MPIQFRSAQSSDLPAIMTIENAGFTPDEAATEASMAARINQYPETFVVAIEDAQVQGYIVGPTIAARYLSDDLFATAKPNSPTAPYLAVLSLAVAPSAQGRGIGSQLLTELRRVAAAQHRRGITLTCLQRLVAFYEANGYVNEGLSASTHAGEDWYNLVLDI